MNKPPRPRNRESFHIALLCALTLESDAVEAIFDGCWRDHGGEFPKFPGDKNTYTTGWIGNHNVVLVYLPGMGKINATASSSDVQFSFPRLRLCLVVGICGGVPGGITGEMILGDVVFSTQVFQYDLGRQYDSDFEAKDTIYDRLGRPNQEIRGFLHQMQGKSAARRLRNRMFQHIQRIHDEPEFEDSRYPGIEEDKLFPSWYRHQHQNPTCCADCVHGVPCEPSRAADCDELGCDVKQLIKRKRLMNPTLILHDSGDTESTFTQAGTRVIIPEPTIHFGAIASGDRVVKSAPQRDLLKHSVVAYEMEGSGVWENIPTLIIKGVCDYADSHKNKGWQKYAAAVAAGCMKAVLFEWSLIDHAVDVFVTDSMASDEANGEWLETRRSCHQSLAFPEMNTRYNQIRVAELNTCEWLPKHDAYQTWLSNHGLLWMKGKPGAGKSVVMKKVVQQATQDLKSPHRIMASFFIHGKGTPLQSSPTGVYRALLHQLLSQAPDYLDDLASIFVRKTESMGNRGESWDWEKEELRTFLEGCITRSTGERQVKLFVDALDEAGVEAASELVADFKRMAAISPNLAICFSCRHYPDVTLDDGLVIVVEHENNDDIKTYVDLKLSTMPTNYRHTQEITAFIQEGASGAFQWVSLVVEIAIRLYKSGRNNKYLSKKLRELPKDLHNLYDDLLKGLEERSQTLSLMEWVAFAIRPLSVNEVRYAMAIDADRQYNSVAECETSDEFMELEDVERRITSLSAGLVEIKEWGSGDDLGDSVLQFIHQSVYDYLLEDGLQRLRTARVQDVKLEADIKISRACLRYLSLKEVQQKGNEFAEYLESEWSGRKHSILSDFYPTRPLEYVDPAFAFIDYAIGWSTHAEAVERSGRSQRDLIDLFRWPSNRLSRTWLNHYHTLNDDSLLGLKSNLLHIASFYGLQSVVAAILDSGKHVSLINAQDEDGYTPLCHAASRGHSRIVRLLLADERVTINTQNSSGATPFIEAIRSGRSEVVAQFLDSSKTDVRARSMQDYTVLHNAIASQHDEVLALLLASGRADVNAKNKFGESALSFAVRKGSWKSVQLVLDTPQVDINSRDSLGRTALSHAASAGFEALVALFLANGETQINLSDDGGQSPLSYAAEEGRADIVALLISSERADLNAKDNQGWTALSRAAYRGHESIVTQLLLSHQLDLNLTDLSGRMPLSYAAIMGDDSIVAQLLARLQIADLDSKDSIGRTALQYAAMFGNSGVVKLLLATGKTQVDSVDIEGNTALSLAIKRHKSGTSTMDESINYEETFRLLQDHQEGLEANGTKL